MSKKLIAVASAAALALTALVGVAPASANTFSVEVQKTAAQSPAQAAATPAITPTGITAAAALNINVPSANVIRSNTTATLTTAAEFHVTTTTARGEVTVSATGGVRLITETQLASSLTTVATGTTTLSDFSSGSKYLFYAINTSTTAGTVVISNAGNSRTIFLAGVSDWAYTLKLTAPASVGPSGNIDITGTIVDAFGNNLTTRVPDNKFVFGRVGVAADPSILFTAATNTYRFRAVAPATAVPVALQVALDATVTPTAVTAFGTPVASQFFTVQVTDLAAAVTSLTAQVAALKADYNALAERWNKRVASKKAPKKAVVLK